jgi:uncharacterized protein with HEPN domain
MIAAAMLQLIEETGKDVLVLVDGVQAHELAQSRLTRTELRRRLLLIADTLRTLPAPACDAMPEIDWAGWRGTGIALAGPHDAIDDALWFAARSLVPATLSWLRIYRKAEPALFAFRP